MDSLILAVLGAVIGLGCWLVGRGIVHRRALPLDELARVLAGTGISAADDVAPTRRSSTGRFSALATRLVARPTGAAGDSLAQRLRLVGKTEADYAVEKLSMAVAGFVLPIVLMVIAVVAGIDVPSIWVVMIAVGLAGAGFFYPDLPLTEQADRRRREFRFALGSYLDFVTIMLAGGAGTQSALQSAAEAGDGWAFYELRNAVRVADSTGRTVWECFDELADQMGLPELQELAASVALAGGQGGRVKDSLSAKADAMRLTQTAELEAMAEARSEKMIIPVVVMIAGLVLFVGGGAVSVVSGGPVAADQATSSEVTTP